MMDTSLGIGAGRRKTLQAIEEKNQLNPVGEPDSITLVTDAVNDIAVPSVLSPPRDTAERIETIHNNLPDDAKPHYIHDKRLLRRINAARRQFNDWIGKRKRMAEIQSPIEAGRSNYPTRRAQKRSRIEREAREELEEKIDRIKSTARGARQRALNAIGSSIAEQTEEQHEQQRTDLREQLSEGAIVQFRNPQLQAGRVIRVNQKSIRVRYPNPRAGALCPMTGEEQSEESEERVQLDSEYLKPLDSTTIEEGTKLLEQRDQS